MFPETTELLSIGCLMEPTWTPRSKSNTLTPRINSKTYWQKEISHVMNGIIFCVCSTSAIFSSINSLKAMSKRTQEDASEERVTAKSKPMMNLVSRYSVRDPNVLASESRVKTKSESQNVPLSSFNVLQTSTVRPVLGASSSNYSEWNIDAQWSSQEWKSGEMSGTSTGTPVDDKFCHRWRYGLWHRHRIEPFSKITIILEQCEWSIAKDAGPFSWRCNARHRQTFYDLLNVYVFDNGSICIHGKELLRQSAFRQN